MTINMNIQNP